ncbi:MAG TPA: hypothetical protein VJT31_24355, partial [Rugosimonospora sp.]|nr:hypothetical protein [Rugosimonospora sp.]
MRVARLRCGELRGDRGAAFPAGTCRRPAHPVPCAGGTTALSIRPASRSASSAWWYASVDSAPWLALAAP